MWKIFGFNKSSDPKNPKDPKDVSSTASPGGALAQNFQELDDFDRLLTSIVECGSSLMEALEKLQTAPSPLLGCLSQSYSKDSAGGELLERLSMQLNACIYRLTLGTPHLEEMMQRVEKVRQQVNSTKEVMRKREAAWSAKVQCDKDAEALKKKGTGQKFTMEERRARLKAKYDADEEYSRLSDEATKQCNEVLYHRWANTAAALTDLCHCYAGIFEAPPKLAGDLLASAARLTARSSSRLFNEPPEALSPTNEDNENNESNENNEHASEYLPSPPMTTENTGRTAPVSSGKGSGQGDASPAPPAASVKSSATSKTGDSGVVRKHSALTPVKSALKKPPPTNITAPPAESARGPKNGATPGALPSYKKGEHVKVWSASQNAWLDAIVTEVFVTDGSHDHYSVPAGVLKVESAAGIKFVQPEQIGKLLQKLDAK